MKANKTPSPNKRAAFFRVAAGKDYERFFLDMSDFGWSMSDFPVL
ncbi:hypothetical protein QY96_00086 [Bacillus thermotolerans]|nr:hypothetical protein QY96_00086 [Bacillus thermotolerans]